jgi:hypothetical protein
MSERCDILLSPGTVTLPDRDGAGEKVIGMGWSGVDTDKAIPGQAKDRKMRPAFDSAIPLWQGARRFAGNTMLRCVISV